MNFPNWKTPCDTSSTLEKRKLRSLVKIWISKNTQVSIRDQLVTQLTLAIASGDIGLNERLPSRGELARRFSIHENTVSSAYKILSDEGIVEFKKGSGFFAKKADRPGSRSALDKLVSRFLREAEQTGADLDTIRDAVLSHLERMGADGIVVLETDEHLRKILIHEISASTGERVTGVSPEGLTAETDLPGRLVALADEKRKIDKSITECVYLNSRSIPGTMAGESRPADDALIALISAWNGFLKMAETILMAAGVEQDSIVVRSTRDQGWQKGLDAASMIIADSLASEAFKGDPRLRTFPIISDESLQILRTLSR